MSKKTRIAKNTLVPMSFEDLREANVKRQKEVRKQLVEWDPVDWAIAVAAQSGRVCKEAALLRRYRGKSENQANDIKDYYLNRMEWAIACLVIQADLLAANLKIDLASAVAGQFNRQSVNQGNTVLLSSLHGT